MPPAPAVTARGSDFGEWGSATRHSPRSTPRTSASCSAARWPIGQPFPPCARSRRRRSTWSSTQYRTVSARDSCARRSRPQISHSPRGPASTAYQPSSSTGCWTSRLLTLPSWLREICFSASDDGRHDLTLVARERDEREVCAMPRVAVLDDYQDVALKMADWSALAPDCRVQVFRDHLTDRDALADRLREFEIVTCMRERTPFHRNLLE